MSLGYVRDYTDPEQLEAAYKAADVELTPIGRTPLNTRVVRLELNDLWIVQVDEASPRLKWAAQSPDRTFIRFMTKPAGDYLINGAPLRHSEIVHLGREKSYFEYTNGPVHWAGMSLPAETAKQAGIALNGFDVLGRPEAWRRTPEPRDMTQLRQLHADAAAVATSAPGILQQPEVARSIEQLLISAVFNCLSDPQLHESSRAQRSHEAVMRGLHAMLENSPDRALYVPEICAALGVPERTLRACCQEQMGMSPKHYLLLRRMHLANRALRSIEPEEKTVTEVATRFGFWHFSRFAGSYRQIFGEAPSATLRRMRR